MRFKEFVGLSPTDYLTRWRMTLATARLTHSRDSVAEIGLAPGYESEKSFSAAFKRIMKCAPPPVWPPAAPVRVRANCDVTLCGIASDFLLIYSPQLYSCAVTCAQCGRSPISRDRAADGAVCLPGIIAADRTWLARSPLLLLRISCAHSTGILLHATKRHRLQRPLASASMKHRPFTRICWRTPASRSTVTIR
ncbi:helix-turn-helix domain-containing protein [Paraburkholderia sp. SIMBA_050]